MRRFLEDAPEMSFGASGAGRLGVFESFVCLVGRIWLCLVGLRVRLSCCLDLLLPKRFVPSGLVCWSSMCLGLGGSGGGGSFDFLDGRDDCGEMDATGSPHATSVSEASANRAGRGGGGGCSFGFDVGMGEE